jgi:hypothetical protein
MNLELLLLNSESNFKLHMHHPAANLGQDTVSPRNIIVQYLYTSICNFNSALARTCTVALCSQHAYASASARARGLVR